MPTRIPQLLILLFLFTTACEKEGSSPCQADSRRLANQVETHCGAAIDMNRFNTNSDYAALVKTHFNSLTAENVMKPEFLHPSQNFFNWTEADLLADYCAANAIRLHGHTLIWHEQVPDWMRNFQGSKTDWENMMKEHIYQIVGHFKGKVSSWDVVNEAFNEDGTLRNSIWKEHIGSSYIEKAFRYAHEADPEAILFYNDFAVAINPVKRSAILSFFNNLRAKGVPVHGIGMQMHIFNGFPENIEIARAMDDIWKNEYILHISELDVSINPFSENMPNAPEDELKRQAEKYFYVFKAYERIPDRYKFGITVWGVGDGDSWIPGFFGRDDYPLLFDANYQPKPAFCKLISDL